MKRVIKDYRSISPELIGLIRVQYPEGYEEEDVITFDNAKGDHLQAIEVIANDVCYLIKVSTDLDRRIEQFSDVIIAANVSEDELLD